MDTNQEISVALPDIINITNVNTADAKCVLFGYNKFKSEPDYGNYGNVKGVLVMSGNPDPSKSYGQFVKNGNKAFKYIRMVNTGIPAQLKEPITITSESMDGTLVSTIIPSTCFKIDEKNPGVCDLIFPLKIDDNTRISFKQLANSTTTFFFYQKSK